MPTYPTIGKHLVRLCTIKEILTALFRLRAKSLTRTSSCSRRGRACSPLCFAPGRNARGRGRGTLLDIKPEVFRLLLHFVYADEIPPGGRAVGALAAAEGDASISGGGADEPGAADARPARRMKSIWCHPWPTLLVAADRFDH